MKRKSTPKKRTLSNINTVTIAFGYGLFTLIVLGVILWTIIPMSTIFFNPLARHFNVALLLLSFVAAAILPALISYFIGDRATHTKNKAAHHYNGVLFGIAAFWIASVLDYIGYSQLVSISWLPIPFGTVVASAVPIVLTITAMAFIAMGYAKKQSSKTSVLEYLPYQLVLFASVVGVYIGIALGGGYTSSDAVWATVLSLGFPVVLALISYKALGKYQKTWRARITEALIAMSFGYITISVIVSFIAYLNLHWSATFIWSYIVAAIVWSAYLYFRTRKRT